MPRRTPWDTAAGFTLSASKQIEGGHPGLVLEELKHNLDLAKSPGLRP